MFGYLALFLISLMSAFAASVSISGSNNIGALSVVPGAQNLKPPACASLTLTNIVRGSGLINGTPGNDLILGSAIADTINGLGGNDCILAGSGDDIIDGGDDDDIVDGGAGTDVCTLGAGTNTSYNCETLP